MVHRDGVIGETSTADLGAGDTYWDRMQGQRKGRR